MSFTPIVGHKRTYNEFNPTLYDPNEESLIQEFVFDAFQHKLLGNTLLGSRALDRAKVLDRTHPLVVHFHRLQLDPINNRIFIG